MSNISIVTAFYDIGRGEWTPDKGLPHYLQRSTETYLERFSRLAKLKNELVVFTSEELAPKILEICKNRKENTKIIPFDIFTIFNDKRNLISSIQTSDQFRSRVNPSQIRNPEYWNADYVLVTNLKAQFVEIAINNGFTTNDMVSWIDFGYFRDDGALPDNDVWNYAFNPEKVHMFHYKEYDGTPITNIIFNNDVYIPGPVIVAHKSKWEIVSELMDRSFNELTYNNCVDDDQGLWLLTYVKKPELFELHRIPDHQLGHDPFVIFKLYGNKR